VRTVRRRRREPIFVIQKHAASSLHYDFRLEVDGVLRSWAIPKGPSTDPRDKRLAVEVEDHPLSWGDFEGVIGSGYGAGAVIVWDTGPYRNLGDVPLGEALDAGRASFWLDGRKLRGGYTLTRTRMRGGKPQWLLIKRRDEEARPGSDVVAEHPRSVLSGRTLDQLPEG
jgi:DNA ligase D-like protein (predicted 3'-phosphoesterase)